MPTLYEEMVGKRCQVPLVAVGLNQNNVVPFEMGKGVRYLYSGNLLLLVNAVYEA